MDVRYVVATPPPPKWWAKNKATVLCIVGLVAGFALAGGCGGDGSATPNTPATTPATTSPSPSTSPQHH
ncbi:hypothetical protein ACT1U9_33020 (plasmid) [Streptomyces sp. BR1]|uniref:hypothetical protein n=1 Tax=Streptomyces sp. BR1 TaxID=1592323 RepID=UPI00402B805E